MISFSETGGSGVTQKELQSIRKANEKLKEENNLLTFKIEILLDMVRLKLNQSIPIQSVRNYKLINCCI